MSTPRFIIVEVPAFTAIKDTLTNETILSIHTRRDAINSRDMTFLSNEEFKLRVQTILEALNK